MKDVVDRDDLTQGYYCRFCTHYVAEKPMPGNSWTELAMYMCCLVPGLIYSIWRRSGRTHTCPSCRRRGLFPVAAPHIDFGPGKLQESR